MVMSTFVNSEVWSGLKKVIVSECESNWSTRIAVV